MNIRQKKVSGEIKHVVSKFFVENKFEQCKNSFITLAKVEISPNLRQVKLFISILNTVTDDEQEECFNSIIKNRKRIKQAIAENINLRNVPEIRIKKDDSFKKAERIKKLLRDIK
ncbi:MAG: 30S ribosome-binding factor RbfA [Candidatus Marinimicrobia bacterium]|nr:30S ribosome-binding factor RbfA [Candidatus Neomarinimicrobiota bacterium]